MDLIELRLEWSAPILHRTTSTLHPAATAAATCTDVCTNFMGIYVALLANECPRRIASHIIIIM